MKVTYQSIGIIHTPFREPGGMPIQPAGGAGIRGWIEVFPAYEEGLTDLGGFSHLILLYHFHRSGGFDLRVVPFMDTEPRGVFATRAPRRPNNIGLSVVRLVRIDGRILHVEDIDICDGTPLLDIKPYVPQFDGQKSVRTGWLERTGGKVRRKKSDGRFA